MRFSRRDLVPLLAIVAGGLIGASLSFSLLSRSDDVVFVVAPVSATYESVEVFLGRERFKEALRLQERDRMEDGIRERVERVRLRRDEVLLQRDIEEGLDALEFRVRKELQDEREPRPRS